MSCSTIPHGRVISGERGLKTQRGCFTCGCSTAPTPPWPSLPSSSPMSSPSTARGPGCLSHLPPGTAGSQTSEGRTTSLRCPRAECSRRSLCDAVTHGCSPPWHSPPPGPGAPGSSPSCCPFAPLSWEVPAEASLCPEHLHLRGPTAKGHTRDPSPWLRGIQLPSKPLARQLFLTALTTGASWPDQKETLLWKGVEEPQTLCSEG